MMDRKSDAVDMVSALTCRRRRASRQAAGPRSARAPDDRERDILSLMAEGRSKQAIGEALFLSARTIESHAGSIFSKLGFAPKDADDRRVLAVLTFLDAQS